MLSATLSTGLGFDVEAIFSKGVKGLELVTRVAEDPALPIVIKRLESIQALKSTPSAPRPKGVSPAPSKPPKKGVGLEGAIKPLDWYILYLKKPWLPYAIVGGTAAVLIGVGVLIGRGSRAPRNATRTRTAKQH